MQRLIRASVLGIFAALGAAGAAAVVPGQSDSFQDASTNGWASGAVHPAPPVNVPTGGPAGAGDGYLLVSALGGAGPGSRLVAIAGPRWAGDYAAAGVDAIAMDLMNFGATELSLRLALFGAGGTLGVSSTAVVLAPGAGWRTVSFSLAPGALAGTALPSLGAISELRLFHGGTARFPGDAVAGQLGIDNVTAVPEPAPAALLAAGLGVLAWRAWRRRR